MTLKLPAHDLHAAAKLRHADASSMDFHGYENRLRALDQATPGP